jgi:hypothetical protein
MNAEAASRSRRLVHLFFAAVVLIALLRLPFMDASGGSKLELAVYLLFLIGAFILSVRIESLRDQEKGTAMTSGREAGKEGADQGSDDGGLGSEKESEEEAEKRKQDRVEELIAECSGESLEQRAEKLLSSLAKNFDIVTGAVFTTMKEDGKLRFLAGYAYYQPRDAIPDLNVGEGLAGKVAEDGESMVLKDVPAGYLKVLTGLGGSDPFELLILPLGGKESQPPMVMELASLRELSDEAVEVIERVAKGLDEELRRRNGANIPSTSGSNGS